VKLIIHVGLNKVDDPCGGNKVCVYVMYCRFVNLLCKTLDLYSYFFFDQEENNTFFIFY